jgi:hypothetical protein
MGRRIGRASSVVSAENSGLMGGYEVPPCEKVLWCPNCRESVAKVKNKIVV